MGTGVLRHLLGATAILFHGSATLALQEPMIGTPSVRPAAITVDTKTEIRFTIEIHDPRLQKVQVEHYTTQGFKRIGRLKDNGKRSDGIAGDGFYSFARKLRYRMSGVEHFRLVAYFKLGAREVSTSVSNEVLVEVTEPGIPNNPRSSDPSNTTTDPDFGQIICNEVMVEFADGVLPSEAISLLSQYGSVVGRSPALRLYQLQLPGTCTPGAVASARAALSALPQVVAATPNGILAPQSADPNDPQFTAGNQHYLGPITGIDSVWQSCTTGSRRMVIAVVDSGVDYNHPDLGLFVFGGRIKSGASFTTLGYQEVGDPIDEDGHGTQVAGIIGARTDNNLCGAGVTWSNPVLAVKVVTWSFMSINEGIRASVDADAKVINVSLGGGCGLNSELVNAAGLNPFKSAVQYATQRDRLIVAAAGNDYGCSYRPLSPAALDDVVAVGAINDDGTLAGSSNTGSWVDIYAPGRGIPVLSLGNSCNLVGEGTSYAAPIVSGAAALVWSLNPTWSAATVRQALVAAAVGSPRRLYAWGAVDSMRPGTEIICDDGVDNDCDGRMDCADTDCASDSLCKRSDSDGDGVPIGSDKCTGTATSEHVDTVNESMLGCSCTQKMAQGLCAYNNACISDSCNPTTAQCFASFNTNPCDDGNCATVSDTCGALGTCIGSPRARVCGDGCVETGETCGEPGLAVCLSDQTCNLQCNCQDSGPADSDEDGVPDGSDSCHGTSTGQVVDASGCSCDQKTCNDTSICTTDSCNATTAQCVFMNNANSCSDGNPCTVGDTCSGGSCVPGGPPTRVCGDGCVETGENCGEPGLPACQAGQVCRLSDCTCQASSPTLNLRMDNVWLDNLSYQQVATPNAGAQVYFAAQWHVDGTGTTPPFMLRVLIDGVQFESYPGFVATAGQTYYPTTTSAWTVTAGSHVVRWELDTTGVVTETNESDNYMVYQWITPSSLDLVADGAIISGGHNPVQVGDVVSFSLNAHCNGSGTTPSFQVQAQLDGGLFYSTSTSVSCPTSFTIAAPSSWTVTAGSHTIQWTLDASNAVVESNEGNNQATSGFTAAGALPDLTVQVVSGPSTVGRGVVYYPTIRVSRSGGSLPTGSTLVEVGFYRSGTYTKCSVDGDASSQFANGTLNSVGSLQQNVLCQVPFSLTAGFVYQFYARVDPYNSISETNDGNNENILGQFTIVQ